MTKVILKTTMVQLLFFFVSFNIQAQCTDGHEPNNSKSAADNWPHPITADYPAVVTPACFDNTSDQDWYRISIDGVDHYILVYPFSAGSYQLKISRSCSQLTIETTAKGSLPQADTWVVFGTLNNNLASDNNSGQGNFSRIVYTLPPSSGPQNYCGASSNTSNYEWIERVSFNNNLNISNNDGGYGDHTNFNTGSFVAGETVWFSIRAGYSGTQYDEYYKIWVDFNQDGDFGDSGEAVYNYDSGSNIHSGFQIPSGTCPGAYRCRIAMSFGSYASSCGNFSYGEVEDYTINVAAGRLEAAGKDGKSESKEIFTESSSDCFTTNQGNEGDPRQATFNTSHRKAEKTIDSYITDVKVFPNPLSQTGTIAFALTQDANVTLEVYDLTGKVVRTILTEKQLSSGTHQERFTTDNLANGIYFYKLLINNKTHTGKIAIKK